MVQAEDEEHPLARIMNSPGLAVNGALGSGLVTANNCANCAKEGSVYIISGWGSTSRMYPRQPKFNRTQGAPRIFGWLCLTCHASPSNADFYFFLFHQPPTS